MIILMMGITGSGKTTVGELLSARLRWTFADADDFHSAANKEKMHRGIALTDADRGPWLSAIRAQMLRWAAANENGVVTCSALKQSYRDFLLAPDASASNFSGEVKIVYLRGNASLIAARVHSRAGHFAGESLLASQLATLEEPQDALTLDVDQMPAQIVAEILRRLHLN
ncbi:MAG: gluconokinase [Acidobacteriota bacterium]|nr:gluconokinase [Acidobacteriota bacterium]